MSTPDVRMKGFKQRASVADAEALIAERVKAPLGVERVVFTGALGRFLAEDVKAPRDVPPFAKSAMDGYAVRAEDTPGKLAVVGEQMAADAPRVPVGRGQAVRIMTGARVPEGADCVVMVEQTRLEGGEVVIGDAHRPASNVLARGEDLTAGGVVLPAGRKIRPQDIAMLATVDALEVGVRRRPRVRIVPTGNELCRAGAREGDKVVESNSYMIEALARRDGAEPVLHPIVPDDKAMIARAIGEPGCDLVVVTGGSSVGQEDLGPVVVRELGELPIHGIAVRPASPTGIGFVNGHAVVLAPGFPVASYVAWDLFARPIVRRLLGAPLALPYPRTRASLLTPHEKPAGRVEVMRVIIERGGASILPGGAALLSTTTRADGFILFPAGQARFDVGSEHEVHLYEGAQACWSATR